MLTYAGTPPRMVAVPTHFFKVVLAERGPAPSSEGGQQDAVLGAFVIPNAPVQPDTPPDSVLGPSGVPGRSCR